MHIGYRMNSDKDTFVTFSDVNFSTSLVDEPTISIKQPVIEDTHIPLHSFSFNPDIYGDSMLSLPKNILRLIPQEKRLKDISVPYHMPHWKLHEFSPSQQRDFIVRYFPDYIELYNKQSQEQAHLFVYLWMYMNGGIYIGPEYELTKSLDLIFNNVPYSDLYFMFDSKTHVSTEFFASQPFCNFWMEAIDHIEKQTNAFEHILRSTQYKFEIISRDKLDPYDVCDTDVKDAYLFPSNRKQNIMTYMSCQTGSTTEELYLAGAAILIIVLIFIIALITR